jgi:2-C-methyl-D-erythritol 4-phosphate cytidylyltransferase
VNNILPDGPTGHESICCGLKALSRTLSPDDIVLIHDGVRPLITGSLISANITKAKEFGAAITVETAAESVVESEDGDIKITAPADYYIFRALYEAMENQQIFGI